MLLVSPVVVVSSLNKSISWGPILRYTLAGSQYGTHTLDRLLLGLKSAVTQLSVIIIITAGEIGSREPDPREPDLTRTTHLILLTSI